MPVTVSSAVELYAVSGEFRALIAYWDQHRRCPLPLVDFLLEHGLESQADVCRWAAAEEERPVSAPTTGERGGKCGPYPTKSSMPSEVGGYWYWNGPNKRRDYAHHVPVTVPTETASNHFVRHPTPVEAILWLLDNWQLPPEAPKKASINDSEA